MRKLETTLAALSVIVLGLNFLLVRYAAPATFLIFGIFSLFYWLFGFALFNNIPFRSIFKKDAYKETYWKRIVGAFLTGYALSIVIIGILFRFQFLPGGKFLLLFGFCCLSIILLIAIAKYEKTKSLLYTRVIKRIIIIGGLGLFLYFLPSNTLVDIKYRNFPEYAEALKNTLNYPSGITTAEKIELDEKLCAEREKMRNGNKETQKFPEVKDLSAYENTNFLPTLEHKIDRQNNAVYCVTLLYAWEEVRKQINLPLTISPKDTDLMLLNNSKSFLNVLKSHEYTASGTIDGDLITARAEFNKSLPFALKLESYDNRLRFKGKPVASFGVSGYSDYEQLQFVKIIYYKNDNNFIIKLLPKDKQHEIILFKSDKIFNSMAEMNEEISKLTEIGKKERKDEKHQWKYRISYEDEVLIPKLKFNIETYYATLEGNRFETSKQKYLIARAWQRTAFVLDESGAEIESEAEIEACVVEEAIENPHPKKMRFDKDFLLLLKRTDAQNPYFGLWVVDTELMVND